MAERRTFSRELWLFTSEFLEVERKALVAAGLSIAAIVEAIHIANWFKDDAKNDINPERILGQVCQLRMVAEQARTAVIAAKDARGVRCLFRRISIGMLGVSTIIADIALVGPIAGVAVGSVAIGGAVIGLAANL